MTNPLDMTLDPHWRVDTSGVRFRGIGNYGLLGSTWDGPGDALISQGLVIRDGASTETVWGVTTPSLCDSPFNHSYEVSIKDGTLVKVTDKLISGRVYRPGHPHAFLTKEDMPWLDRVMEIAKEAEEATLAWVAETLAELTAPPKYKLNEEIDPWADYEGDG